MPKSKNVRAWVWRRGHERTQGLYFSGKKSKREGLSMQKRAWADSGPLFLCQKVKTWGPECAKEGMSVLRASILCLKVKKGGPERVKRGPEGLSLFTITPEKACSFFAPWGARWSVNGKGLKRGPFNPFPLIEIYFQASPFSIDVKTSLELKSHRRFLFCHRW